LALAEVAKAMAQAGYQDQARRVLNQALSIAGKMPEEGERFVKKGEVWVRIVEAMAWAGEWDRALQAVEGIEAADRKLEALVGIGEGMAQAGEKGRARQVFEQALQIAEGVRGIGRKSLQLTRIGSGMAQIGEWDRALQVVEEIPMKNDKVTALIWISAWMREKGERNRYRETLERALRIAESIEEAPERANVLGEVASYMASMGEEAWAQEALDQALQVTGTHTPVAYYAAQVMVLLGKEDQAFRLADEVEEGSSKSSVFITIAMAMAATGAKARSLEVLERARQSSETIEKPTERATRLAEIAAVMAYLGERDRARSILDQALQTVEAIGGVSEESWEALDNLEAMEKSWSLSSIAAAMAQLGEWDRALRVVRTIPWPLAKVSALQGMARMVLREASAERPMAGVRGAIPPWSLWEGLGVGGLARR
jgi:tetratricopeptide (TPR) repeat protein